MRQCMGVMFVSFDLNIMYFSLGLGFVVEDVVGLVMFCMNQV